MAKLLLVLATIGVIIYALIDCWRSEESEIRGLPKPLWLFVILFLPLLGGVLWITLGRQPVAGAPKSRRLRTIGPDDDPDFLRTLQLPRTRGGGEARGNGDRRRPEGEDDEDDPKPS